MAKFLSEAEWKKNVNKLLGAIHKKTGVTEALKAYEALLVKGAAPSFINRALVAIDTLAKKLKGVYKTNKAALAYFDGMIKEAADAKVPFVDLNGTLTNAKYCKVFKEFLKTEYSAHQLEYWELAATSKGYKTCMAVAKMYVGKQAKKQANIGNDYEQQILAVVNDTTMSDDNKGKDLEKLFMKSRDQVLIPLDDSYGRFQKTKLYRDMF